MTKTNYPSLNGLRALSIMFPLVSHLNIKDWILNGLWGKPWLDPFLFFITDGHIGVSVFFVISGFLITSLMLNEEAATKTVSLKKFYIRRTLRIFPAYYFMLFVYAILQYMHILHISPNAWFTAITYTKYLNWDRDWYTAHAWSLSIEEQFYLCWPLIFLTGSQIRKACAFAIVILVPCMRVYFHVHPSRWVSEMSLLLRADSIATGCLIAMYRDCLLKALRAYFTLLFYVSIAGLLAFPYVISWADKHHAGAIFIPLGGTHGTLGIAFMAIIILYSVFGPQRLWYKMLNLQAVNFIGQLSYSIYLWQMFFVSNNGLWVTRLPQSLAFIIIAALCSYYFIEKPFDKLRAKYGVKV
jgi:peptidoglycan/LPS O-acetylase OafA/YrhL